MQLRAVALEAAFEGDITFVCHLVRESGINLDDGNIEVSCLAKFLYDLSHCYSHVPYSLMEQL